MRIFLLIITLLVVGETTSEANWIPRRYYRNNIGYQTYWWYRQEPRLNYAEIEQIRRQATDERKARIQSEWDIKDAAKERREKNSLLNQKEQRLNNLERAHALNLREKDLIGKGVISRSQHSESEKGIVVDGIRFKTFAEFAESPTFDSIKAKQIDEQARKAAKQEALDEEIKQGYIAEWRRRTFASPTNVFRGGIVDTKIDIELMEPNVYEQMRRNRNLVNSPDEFMKKFGVSYSEWLEFRREVQANDLK